MRGFSNRMYGQFWADFTNFILPIWMLALVNSVIVVLGCGSISLLLVFGVITRIPSQTVLKFRRVPILCFVLAPSVRSIWGIHALCPRI